MNQLKSCEFSNETCHLFNSKEVSPGYYRSSDMILNLLLQCELCRQASTDLLSFNVSFVEDVSLL